MTSKTIGDAIREFHATPIAGANGGSSGLISDGERKKPATQGFVADLVADLVSSIAAEIQRCHDDLDGVAKDFNEGIEALGSRVAKGWIDTREAANGVVGRVRTVEQRLAKLEAENAELKIAIRVLERRPE